MFGLCYYETCKPKCSPDIITAFLVIIGYKLCFCLFQFLISRQRSESVASISVPTKRKRSESKSTVFIVSIYSVTHIHMTIR